MNSDFYFVDSMVTKPDGSRMNGFWKGFHGWNNGFYGPTTWAEAKRVSALIGGRIIEFGEIGQKMINDRIAEILAEDSKQKRVYVSDVVNKLNGQEQKDRDELLNLQNAPYPNYQEMIKEMAANDFPWEEVTGGSRKKDDVTAAYKAYREKLLYDYLNG